MMMLGNGPRARTFFETVRKNQTKEASERALLLTGLSFARDGEWREAEQTFNAMPADSSSGRRDRAASLARLSSNGSSLGRKHPALAGVLGLIPGMGYLYSGFPQTAIASLVVNGLFMGGTYKAFSHGNKPLGTMLGIVGIGWYSGNITGSVSTARRTNDLTIQRHLRRFDLGFTIGN
ncbi:MAG: hypothetical protein ABL907_08570 [Hyphomicrobium sp.]